MCVPAWDHLNNSYTRNVWKSMFPKPSRNYGLFIWGFADEKKSAKTLVELWFSRFISEIIFKNGDRGENIYLFCGDRCEKTTQLTTRRTLPFNFLALPFNVETVFTTFPFAVLLWRKSKWFDIFQQYYDTEIIRFRTEAFTRY